MKTPFDFWFFKWTDLTALNLSRHFPSRSLIVAAVATVIFPISCLCESEHSFSCSLFYCNSFSSLSTSPQSALYRFLPLSPVPYLLLSSVPSPHLLITPYRMRALPSLLRTISVVGTQKSAQSSSIPLQKVFGWSNYWRGDWSWANM